VLAVQLPDLVGVKSPTRSDFSLMLKGLAVPSRPGPPPLAAVYSRQSRTSRRPHSATEAGKPPGRS
jgi:hypothetical protein